MADLHALSSIDLLTTLTREIEWTLHSMFRSDEGYSARVKGKVDAINMLTGAEAWNLDGSEDMEDAREVAQLIKRVAGRKKTTSNHYR